MLCDIHSEFGLDSSKILATVTDNASNFAKAFRVFGVKLCNFQRDVDGENNEFSDTSADEESDDENFQSIPMDPDEECALEPNKPLPQHLRCCAHTLNLCVASDAIKAINSFPLLLSVHEQAMAKCTVLWRFVGRPKSAEILMDILGHTLSRPGETRWNSLYDSLRQIVKIREKCPQLSRALNIKNTLKETDFIYIEEHLSCVAPVAEALDILQGENNVYYGIVLPCLFALRKKLQVLQNKELKYCRPLSDALLESVERRFKDFFDMSAVSAQNAAIATLSYPRFRNRWLSCIGLESAQILSFFKKTVAAESNCVEVSEKETDPFDDYFDFAMESQSAACGDS
ncbi:uncharacterized protein LOC112452944, partial [Temnothorax curvispinosus]|uniref:Uncharacterized protein LOC112452944 n=1 Tax=Temnothorax curvispinosus TaxID=300111 RepID=A0A6J1PIH2_9HYME